MSNRSPVAVAATAALVTLAQPAIAQSSLDEIRESGSIAMGVAIEPPYTDLTSDGTLTGADPEVAREIFSELGDITLDPNVVDWGALIPGLIAGRFDAVATGLFIRPERCEAVIFSEPVLCTTEAFIVETGNPLGITTYQELVDSDAMFSTVAGSEERRALDLGMPPSRIMVTSDIYGSLDLLRSGRVDIIGFPDTTLRVAIEQLPDGEFEVISNLEGEPIQCSGAAFAQGQEELRDFYDEGLARLQESGRFTEILQEYNFDPALNEDVDRAGLCEADS